MKSICDFGWRILPVILTIATVTVIAPARVRAAETVQRPFSGYTKYVWYRSHYVVNADGTDVESHDWALKVLTAQGIADANLASVDYSDSLQRAEIIAAYTLKADGRHINVPISNFQEEINKGEGQASPMFSDIRTKTVAFPEVGVGDTVVMSYRIVQKEAMFPGNFSVTEVFSRFEAYDNVEVTISAPAGLAVHVYQRGVAGGTPMLGKNGQRLWRWTYRNQEVAIPETGSVSPLDNGPLIVASTFKDWAPVAAAYDIRARPKAIVTPAIRRLSDQLTIGAQDPRAQAKAIYDWVAVNIQYAGDEAGVGSVVPHAADVVLANRMGDCKDHTVLLQALLAAKGIASTPVLINAGAAYSLPPVASTDVFDHMINYIPLLDLYVDSTSRYTPFGSLPFADSDKPVVHTIGFTEVRRTPASGFNDNRMTTATQLTINPDGSANGLTKIQETGFVADELRAQMTFLQPNMEDLLVQRVLERTGFAGAGTLFMDDPSALTLGFGYGAKYQLSNDAYIVPGPAALSVRPPFGGSRSTIGGYVEGANEPHTMNFECYGGEWKERYEIRMPDNVKILAIPRNVTLSGKDLHYQAEYQLNGHTVTAERDLQDRTPGNVCTPADAAATRDFARGIRRDLRSQVLYQ
jgi:transglutaminase-like putative cysteine protease